MSTFEAPPTGPVAPTATPNGPVAPQTVPTGPVAPQTAPTGPVVPQAAPTGPVVPQTAPTGPVVPGTAPTGPVVPGTAPTAPVVAEAMAGVAPQPTQAHTRRGAPIAALIVVALVAVAALGVGGYMWLAADRWQADSEAWEAQARAHGEAVADLRVELETATADLNLAREELGIVQGQLDTAQQRIIELADQSAQLGDQAAIDAAILEYQRSVSTAAGNVARALDQCMSHQAQLIDALRTPDRFTPESVDAFGAEVQRFCQQAADANAALQAELQR